MSDKEIPAGVRCRPEPSDRHGAPFGSGDLPTPLPLPHTGNVDGVGHPAEPCIARLTCIACGYFCRSGASRHAMRPSQPQRRAVQEDTAHPVLDSIASRQHSKPVLDSTTHPVPDSATYPVRSRTAQHTQSRTVQHTQSRQYNTPSPGQCNIPSPFPYSTTYPVPKSTTYPVPDSTVPSPGQFNIPSPGKYNIPSPVPEHYVIPNPGQCNIPCSARQRTFRWLL